MDDKKIRVAITHGDTNGIGYELIFKTFAEPAMLELCTPVIYGSPKIAAYHRNMLGVQANFTIINRLDDIRDGKVNMLPAFDKEIKIETGKTTPEAGQASLKALERAMNDFKNGLFDVLVALPVNKSAIQKNGILFKSQTDFVENNIETKQKALTILINEKLRIGMVTDQIPVKETAQAISQEIIEEKGTILWNTLKRDFRISNPRIAVLSLNPLAEDGSFTGSEEEKIILPAIRKMESNGIQAYGPYAVDKFFGDGYYEAFDGVLAMYQDQAKAPFNTLDMGDGISYMAGLPIICTSPLQGISYEIAGKGVADESSFRNAIYYAIDICRNRIEYDRPLENPLPKLYHEKKDESEKVRFTIPKAKNENKKPE